VSAQETTEVELKYDLDTNATVPDLTVLPAVQSLSGPVIEHLDATYYDTDALDLAGNKITLRRPASALPWADARCTCRCRPRPIRSPRSWCRQN
jgi:hypothetical protein